jgi:hypothetical protein
LPIARFSEATCGLSRHPATGRGKEVAQQRAFRKPEAKEELVMLGIMNDLRNAMRSLRGAPVFTALAVLSLALGIGANTAIFSLLDGSMFRSLRVTEPDRLVTLEQVLPDGSRLYFSVQDAERFEQLPQVFASISATAWADGYNIAAGAQVDERLARVSIVTGTFFQTNDPVTILAAALTICAVSIAAAAAPARWAARLDPMVALRCD